MYLWESKLSSDLCSWIASHSLIGWISLPKFLRLPSNEDILVSKMRGKNSSSMENFRASRCLIQENRQAYTYKAKKLNHIKGLDIWKLRIENIWNNMPCPPGIDMVHAMLVLAYFLLHINLLRYITSVWTDASWYTTDVLHFPILKYVKCSWTSEQQRAPFLGYRVKSSFIFWLRLIRNVWQEYHFL